MIDNLVTLSKISSFIPDIKFFDKTKKIKKNSKKFKINLWRNTSFEFLYKYIDHYSSLYSLNLKFNVSDYDDTISFNKYTKSNLEILWIDITRYKSLGDNWLNWIDERINTLNFLSNSPILFIPISDNYNNIKKCKRYFKNKENVYFCDIFSLFNHSKLKLIDKRLEKVSGSILSFKSQIIIARKIVCHWIPSLILPPIKAIAIDMDNTLYRGVLGEDQINGITINSSYKKLHRYLIKIKKLGIILNLVSKNNYKDAELLFKKNKNFEIKFDDFFLKKISWSEKSNSIIEIAKKINIYPDSILFVDDNIAENLKVNSKIINSKTILATNNPIITMKQIQFYPGVWQWERTNEDQKRLNDIKAQQKRNVLFNKKNKSNYLQELNTKIKIYINNINHIDRVSQLSLKTNQFVTTFKRYNSNQISKLINKKNINIVTTELSDKLSESGIISIVVGKLVKNIIYVEEMCISCRALGRDLENNIILNSIKSMNFFNQSKKILFKFKLSNRNQPAENWLKKNILIKKYSNRLSYEISNNNLIKKINNKNIKVENFS